MNRQPIQPDQSPNQQQIPSHISSLQVNQMDWIIKPYVDPVTKNSKGGLAISNIQFCQNRQKMQRQSFKAVLSVCGDKLVIPVVVQHLWIVIDDHPRENISSFFANSYSFIERNRQIGNVLVHCRAGISRSCSIVIAYLMKKNNINYDKALELVRTYRPIAYPNKGFAKQLKRYANQVIKQQKQDNKGKECLIF